MKPQYDNQVLSSFLLWFDNKLLTKGECYTNHSSQFFDMAESISYGTGYNTYGAPFKQFVYDQSITGAQLFTGIVVTETGNAAVSIPLASGHIYSLDPTEGQVTLATGHFSDKILAVTGHYSVKDFSIKMATEPEEKLLFETKYAIKPTTTQTISTGMYLDEEAFPIIYLKNNGSMNQPAAFGGHDFTKIDIRAIVLADSQFNLDAVFSIFRDTVRENFYLFDEAEYPFNFAGSYKDNVIFNYTGTCGNTNLGGPKGAFIEDVTVAALNTSDLNEYQNVDAAIFAGLIDFTVSNLRTPG